MAYMYVEGYLGLPEVNYCCRVC